MCMYYMISNCTSYNLVVNVYYLFYVYLININTLRYKVTIVQRHVVGMFLY